MVFSLPFSKERYFLTQMSNKCVWWIDPLLVTYLGTVSRVLADFRCCGVLLPYVTQFSCDDNAADLFSARAGSSDRLSLRLLAWITSLSLSISTQAPRRFSQIAALPPKHRAKSSPRPPMHPAHLPVHFNGALMTLLNLREIRDFHTRPTDNAGLIRKDSASCRDAG